MLIGDVLVAQGLVSREDVEAALERQRNEGGLLGEHLIALGKLDPADLERVMKSSPPSPRDAEETGLSLTDLLNLIAKTMYSGAEMPSVIGGILKLPQRVIQQVLEQMKERKMLDVLGSTGTFATSELRYALTEKGRQWAVDALAQNQYVGPAPVPLSALVERIQRQRITNERVDRGAVERAFSDLIISEAFIHQIGPAINSGRSILLYGPPGNGKTSVAERIGALFSETIYIPYCFEVEGQIIKVFDPGIHKRIERSVEGAARGTLRRENFDLRWVPCRRPFIVTGGELTLEMLDLSFNALAKFYEAPLHIKALGGIFTIDDFGRQLVSPEALLNRWIVPPPPTSPRAI
jgi:predicted ATPase with chaperone activity